MFLRMLCLCFLLCHAFLIPRTAAAREATPPNIVVIMADDKYELREEFGNSSRKSPQFFGEPNGKADSCRSRGITADSGELTTLGYTLGVLVSSGPVVAP